MIVSRDTRSFRKGCSITTSRVGCQSNAVAYVVSVIELEIHDFMTLFVG